MDEEQKQLLHKMFAMVEENNKLLHRMRSAERTRSVIRMVYWVLIIGFTIWSFYTLGPLLDNVIKVYQGVDLSGLQGFDASKMLQQIQQ